MSIQAMVWAMRQQEIKDHAARHVLLCLANFAGEKGQAAFPAVSTLAEHTGLSERTVKRKLGELEQAGMICRGNQLIAAAYIQRQDRRPVVYDLAVDLGDTMTPRGKPREQAGENLCTNGPQSVHRGDSDGSNGVTATTERGDTVTPDTSLTKSSDPLEPELAKIGRKQKRYGGMTTAGVAVALAMNAARPRNE